MKRLVTACTLCCAICGLSLSTPIVLAQESNDDNRSRARIGTFDSRLVATAYVRSEKFGERLKKMHAELKKAKEAGNEKRVKQLEDEGPALQSLVHKQGFSTWPIHDILKNIKDEIPKIAKEAKVDIIVSKWELVFQDDGVQPIDVTDQMVALFKPDQATRNVLESLRKQDPVPLDELKTH